jgi:chaperone modulatory protein CbpM
LNAWIEDEWLIPSGSSVELSFSDLRVEFGVNDEGVGLILNLVDQLYAIRRTLMELRHAVRATSEQG